MDTRDPQLDLIYEAVRQSGLEPRHAHYTEVFERHLPKNATLAQKHDTYEALLARAAESTDHSIDASGLRVPTQSERRQQIPSGRGTSPAAHLRTEEVEKSLFESAPLSPMQAWSLPPKKQLAPKHQERKERIEQVIRKVSSVGDSRLGRKEFRIAYLLHHYPETRDSDTTLCIFYWRKFQSDILERTKPFDLEVLYDLERIETIGRLRRLIQNTLGMYRSKKAILKARRAIQAEFSELIRARRGIPPEIRFYFDETGNEGPNKLYRGIAGICVMNWKHFAIHFDALSLWRSTNLLPMPIHFCDMTEARMPDALRLLQQLEARRGGLLFVGHAVHSRGRTADDYCAMMVQIVLDSLHRSEEIGCLNEPRTIRVIKEADVGFDEHYAADLTEHMRRTLEEEFPGSVIVEPIESKMKGKDVLLECADLIAGGMQRRALYGGRNPKDQLAEAVITAAGFEDASNEGAVFRYHVPHST